MRRMLPRLLWIALLLAAFAALAGCGILNMVSGIRMETDTVYEIEVGEFDYTGINVCVSYTDGTEETIPLTPEMIPAAEQLKFFRPGRQTVRVTLDQQSCEMTVFVKRSTMSGLTLAGESDSPIVYDGKSHSMTVRGDLPEGAQVRYPNGNVFTAAGKHEVTATVVCEGYETVELTAILEIKPAEYDLSGVGFDGLRVVYSGEPVTVTAVNLPEDLRVSYRLFGSDGKTELSEAVDAGTYYVTMSAACGDTENYLPIEDKTVELTILPATYDLSGVTFEDASVTYDGALHDLRVAGQLPKGVTVSYSARRILPTEAETEVRDAGEYLFTATFTGDAKNYQPIPPMQATLTVEKQVVRLENVTFNSYYCDFDGAPHALSVTGELPAHVNVTYTYNGEAASGMVRAGTYEAVATFTHDDPANYTVLPATLGEDHGTALIIRPIVGSADFSSEHIFYAEDAGDGESRYRIAGLAKGVIPTVIFRKDGEEVPADQLTLGETYQFEASFAFGDEDWAKSVTIPSVVGEVTLRVGIEIPSFTFSGKTVTYDGEAHSIVAAEEIPDGVITYENNGQTGVGAYTVVATVDESRYLLYTSDGRIITRETATLRIEKRRADLAGLSMEDLSVDYDGEEHSLTLNGIDTVPDWVTVTVVNNGHTDAGLYVVTVEIDYDRELGEVTFNGLSASLRIKKITADLSSLKLEDLTVTYDGTEHTIEVTGGVEIPDWVTIQYTDNRKTDAGTYNVKAHFVYDEKNYDIGTDDLTATMIINKAPIDFTDVDLSTQEYVYDGTMHNFVITGLPEGVSTTVGMNTSLVGNWTKSVIIGGGNYQEYVKQVTMIVHASRSCFTLSMSILPGSVYQLNFYQKSGVYNQNSGIQLMPLSVVDENGTNVGKTELSTGHTYTWTLTTVYNNGDSESLSGTVTFAEDGTYQEGAPV